MSHYSEKELEEFLQEFRRRKNLFSKKKFIEMLPSMMWQKDFTKLESRVLITASEEDIIKIFSIRIEPRVKEE